MAFSRSLVERIERPRVLRRLQSYTWPRHRLPRRSDVRRSPIVAADATVGEWPRRRMRPFVPARSMRGDPQRPRRHRMTARWSESAKRGGSTQLRVGSRQRRHRLRHRRRQSSHPHASAQQPTTAGIKTSRGYSSRLTCLPNVPPAHSAGGTFDICPCSRRIERGCLPVRCEGIALVSTPKQSSSKFVTRHYPKGGWRSQKIGVGYRTRQKSPAVVGRRLLGTPLG